MQPNRHYVAFIPLSGYYATQWALCSLFIPFSGYYATCYLVIRTPPVLLLKYYATLCLAYLVHYAFYLFAYVSGSTIYFMTPGCVSAFYLGMVAPGPYGSRKTRYLIWSMALAIGCLPLY